MTRVTVECDARHKAYRERKSERGRSGREYLESLGTQNTLEPWLVLDDEGGAFDLQELLALKVT